MRPCCSRGSTLLVSSSWRVWRGRWTGSGACGATRGCIFLLFPPQPARAAPESPFSPGTVARAPPVARPGAGRRTWTRWSCLDRGGAVPSRGLRYFLSEGGPARAATQCVGFRNGTPGRAARGPPGRAPTLRARCAAAASFPTRTAIRRTGLPRPTRGAARPAAATGGMSTTSSGGGVAGTCRRWVEGRATHTDVRGFFSSAETIAWASSQCADSSQLLVRSFPSISYSGRAETPRLNFSPATTEGNLANPPAGNPRARGGGRPG